VHEDDEGKGEESGTTRKRKRGIFDKRSIQSYKGGALARKGYTRQTGRNNQRERKGGKVIVERKHWHILQRFFNGAMSDRLELKGNDGISL